MIAVGQEWYETARPGHRVRITEYRPERLAYSQMTFVHLSAHNKWAQSSPTASSVANFLKRYKRVGTA